MKVGNFIISFDGTCVTNDYPEIGISLGANYVLKALEENGSRIILNTTRSNDSNQSLSKVLNWFNVQGIKLFNLNQLPTTDSFIISINCVGVPLVKLGMYEVLDWTSIISSLYSMGFLSKEQSDYCKNKVQEASISIRIIFKLNN